MVPSPGARHLTRRWVPFAVVGHVSVRNSVYVARHGDVDGWREGLMTEELQTCLHRFRLCPSGEAFDARSEGRPDIDGRDDSGVRRLLVEAKFDAALTAPQESPEGYLNWLPVGTPGAFFFLVPSNRMPAVWPQLLAGPAQVESVPPPHLTHRDVEWLTHHRPNGRVVAALSWEALLCRLHQAQDGGLDPVASSELVQLDGLVTSQIKTWWVPLTPGDLSDRTG